MSYQLFVCSSSRSLSNVFMVITTAMLSAAIYFHFLCISVGFGEVEKKMALDGFYRFRAINRTKREAVFFLILGGFRRVSELISCFTRSYLCKQFFSEAIIKFTNCAIPLPSDTTRPDSPRSSFKAAIMGHWNGNNSINVYFYPEIFTELFVSPKKMSRRNFDLYLETLRWLHTPRPSRRMFKPTHWLLPRT